MNIKNTLAKFARQCSQRLRIASVRQPAGIGDNESSRNSMLYPAEFDDADRSVFDYVLSNNLTMVGRERLIATLLACKHVCSAGIEGDFVECGVWRGGNSLVAADVFDRMMTKKRVYLFDTFAGMTEPAEIDERIGVPHASHPTFVANQRKSHNEWCYAPLEEVAATFRKRGLLNRAQFIKGDVTRTLDDDEHLPTKIAVLRLDTDWYASTRKELETLWPRLQPGGVLMIDDYGYWRGSKEAVDEYFAGPHKPYLHYIDQSGRLAIKY
jgi:O-methyltransferase